MPTQAVDFAPTNGADSPQSVPSDDLDVEAQHDTDAPSSRDAPSTTRILMKHDANMTTQTEDHNSSPEPLQRSDTGASKSTTRSFRRRGRAPTSLAYGAVEMGRTTGWAPGLEPGVDTSEPPSYDQSQSQDTPGRHLEALHQACEITIVDYSAEEMSMKVLDNDNLEEYLRRPAEDWSQVRWININGLSWDVIRAIGKYKNLHRLAIEDLMNTRNRTKADWYHDHTYIVLPLQKLFNVKDADSSDSEDEEEHEYDDYVHGVNMRKMDTRTQVNHERKRRQLQMKRMKQHKGAIKTLIAELFGRKKKSHQRDRLQKSNSFKNAGVASPYVSKNVRTLQQYHAGPNLDRIDYMTRKSTLGKRGLGVSVEQVSIFLTADNTVISFFEYSAQDVEVPILRRLQSENTILRQSCDASMLMQSILDTIIDLAIPVTTAYQDAIGDLELDVLTDPDIAESTALYILTSEIAVLRQAVAPIIQLIDALKDHKTHAAALTVSSRLMTPMADPLSLGSRTPQPQAIPRPSSERPETSYFQSRTQIPTAAPAPRETSVNSGVTISPLTITYLGDVEDHAQLISESYDQMRRSADNLVDLIFNIVSAYQNESMKQLTVVTCFFLPLSFMTGYFGMNFHIFAAVDDNTDAYFWEIAGPVCGVVIIILLREWISRFFVKWANKSLIRRGRKRRLAGPKT